MTTPTIADNGRPQSRQRPDAAGWLGLAASPVFAVMAGLAAGSPSDVICASGGMPLHGMASMYLLMSLFHLPAWLKLAAGRRHFIQSTTRTEGN